MSGALLKLALDALMTCEIDHDACGMNSGYTFDDEIVYPAIQALTAALAQPQPEPFAWSVGRLLTRDYIEAVFEQSLFPELALVPLYAAPPASAGDKS